MMYAMAMVAEREIPARQCTMTLQFDTLALSVGGETNEHEYTQLYTDTHNTGDSWQISSLAESVWRQSVSTESDITRKSKGSHLNGHVTPVSIVS